MPRQARHARTEAEFNRCRRREEERRIRERLMFAERGEIDAVYFVGDDESGPVKVGFTTAPLDERLAQLQVGNPAELGVLGALWLAPQHETVIHRALAPHHIRGEWFERRAALAQFYGYATLYPWLVLEACPLIWGRVGITTLDPDLDVQLRKIFDASVNELRRQRGG